MSLWDGLSGKTLRWNATQSEATCRVCRTLRPFVSSRLTQYPRNQQFFTDVRNMLFAYFLSASMNITRMLDGEFKEYKERFYSFNAELYLRFIAPFHAAHVVMANSSPEMEQRLYLMSEGIEDMYGYPLESIRAWWQRVDQLRQGPADTAVMWMGDQLRSEIVPSLGLAANNSVLNSFFGFK